jgi:hypothetical protein
MQGIKESSTLRVGSKRQKSFPRIVHHFGSKEEEIKNFLNKRKEIKNVVNKIN